VEGNEQGQRSFTTSVSEDLDIDTGELVPEMRDLFSECPALQYAGPEKAGRALHALRGIRVDACTVEVVPEALRIEGEVLV
jgi:hypothetical protein